MKQEQKCRPPTSPILISFFFRYRAVQRSICFPLASSYNNVTEKGTAASRVFFHLVAEAVRMREKSPDPCIHGLTRPLGSPSLDTFATFDLRRLYYGTLRRVRDTVEINPAMSKRGMPYSITQEEHCERC